MNYRNLLATLVVALFLTAPPVLAKHTVGDTPKKRADFAQFQTLDSQGHDLLVQGQFAEAEVYLRRALDFYPDEAAAQIELGLALDRQGQTDEAFEYYQKAVGPSAIGTMSSNFPEDIEAYARYGLMCETRGQHAEAVRCYNQVLSWANAGSLLETMDAQRDSPVKVRAMLTIMRGIGIESALGQEGMARTAEALAVFQEAAALLPSDAHTQFFVADSLRKAGRFEEAKAVLLKVPKLDTDGKLKAATEKCLKQIEIRQR